MVVEGGASYPGEDCGEGTEEGILAGPGGQEVTGGALESQLLRDWESCILQLIGSSCV